MKSMTGHGRGDCAQDGYTIAVEVQAVNRRQLEVALVLPRELESLETRIREAVHRAVARGRVTVKILWHGGAEAVLARVRANLPLARAYVREVRRLHRELGLPGEISAESLGRWPGVLRTEEEWVDTDRFWKATSEALAQALGRMVRMRTREGSHLAADLKRRARAMRRSLARIRRQAPKVIERYRDQLRARVAAAGLDRPAIDDERLLREIVYYTDRSDISEELARLESHFQQFEDCLRAIEPVGRTLDFLAQEMNREVNTIGSKANDSLISREVVVLKTELEKFREQSQNVE